MEIGAFVTYSTYLLNMNSGHFLDTWEIVEKKPTKRLGSFHSHSGLGNQEIKIINNCIY